MDEARLKLLFRKYINKTISDTERQEFYKSVADPGSMELLRRYAEAYDIPKSFNVELPDDVASRILSNILSADKQDVYSSLSPIRHESHKRRRKYFLEITGAAAAVSLLMVAYYFYVGNKGYHTDKIVTANRVIKDALPGHTGAILTLSNGKAYLLDTAHNGMITRGIRKSDKGVSVSPDDDISYATLSTPYGREQKLELSDGTLVWLNAGSSIHFPTIFKGRERRVEITGEVYFEVAHNNRQPFVVVAGKDQIQDLGTHFDINAYEDESVVKTTLLEGSVRIGSCTLKPGQQYANGNVKEVNADASVAWVSGFFQFEDADVRNVMRQLARWYNVEVQYEGGMPSQKFEGEIQRSLKLSQVLDLIAGAGIHYTLNGHRLIIRS